MAKKNSLFSPSPIPSVSAKSMAASFNSDPIVVTYLDNIALQIVATGTPSGTFAVQVSNDYNPQFPSGSYSWVSLSLSGVPTLTGSGDTIDITLNQVPYPYLRVAYTRTSGTGICNIFAAGKEV